MDEPMRDHVVLQLLQDEVGADGAAEVVDAMVEDARAPAGTGSRIADEEGSSGAAAGLRIR